MRILLMGTAVCQIYDQVTLGDILDQHENGRFVEENARRHVNSQGELRNQIIPQQVTVSPTIRPREFVNGSAFQQPPASSGAELRVETHAASGALTPASPAITAEEGLQFLHKLVSQGASQAEKLGKALMSELSTAVSKREPFLATSNGSRPLRNEGAQTLQQQSAEFWSHPAADQLATSLASAVLEQSPVWPWWRSTTMFNEAVTRSAVDILTTMGYNSQTAIDGWFGVADEWTKVLNSVADFQQRLNQALWKLQGWTVRLLLPTTGELTGEVIATTTPQVLNPNLALSAELLASSAQRAGAIEETEDLVTGMAFESAPVLEFLPLELSSYARH